MHERTHTSPALLLCSAIQGIVNSSSRPGIGSDGVPTNFHANNGETAAPVWGSSRWPGARRLQTSTLPRTSSTVVFRMCEGSHVLQIFKQDQNKLPVDYWAKLCDGGRQYVEWPGLGTIQTDTNRFIHPGVNITIIMNVSA